MTTRQLEITNVYVGVGTIVTTVTVEVDDPTDYTPEAYHKYLDEELFQYTGTGRMEGEAGYFVKSTDGLEPPIDLEYV